MRIISNASSCALSIQACRPFRGIGTGLCRIIGGGVFEGKTEVPVQRPEQES